jgi:hypothetical protein
MDGKQRKMYIGFTTFFVLLIFITCLSQAKDRCNDYIPDIRSYGMQFNGADFPYWYNIGCAITESNCRGNITSFDGGQGIFQLTPSTGVTAYIQKYIPVDPYNVQSSIRAQSYYIMMIRTKIFKVKSMKFRNTYIHPEKFVSKCGLNLSDVYRYYNGGYWFFYESERAGIVCDNKEMVTKCVRGGTWVGTGKKRRWLSFCEVNYSYPDKVYNYSKKYKIGKDGQRYWYNKGE